MPPGVELVLIMGWPRELQQALEKLQAGSLAEVGFAGHTGLEGELGSEWNRFAGEMVRLPGGKLSREQRHDLLNQLAGILAAVHVLRETATLTEEDREALQRTIEDAKKIEAQLRSR